MQVERMHRGEVACAVAVVVTHAGKVLFGRRRRHGGAWTWQLPGGWIESGESPPDAARREVAEETGLTLGELKFVAVSSNVFSPREHSISLYFEAECRDASALAGSDADGESVWIWRQWNQVEENLFLPLRLLRQSDYRPFSPDASRTHISF